TRREAAATKREAPVKRGLQCPRFMKTSRAFRASDPPLVCDAIAIGPKIADRSGLWETLGSHPRASPLAGGARMQRMAIPRSAGSARQAQGRSGARSTGLVGAPRWTAP